MPFLAKEKYPLSNKDILSWTFDDYSHDWDEPIYIDAINPSRSISARQAKTLIRQLVAGFKAIGVEKGGIFAGTNPAYTKFELAHTLKTAKVKFILSSPDILENVLHAAKENGIPKERVIIFNPAGESAPGGYLQWKDLLQHGEQDWVRFDDYNTSYNAGAARLFSSGTTGLPKAAELTHYNLIAQHMLVYEANERPYKSIRLIALPMFHAAAAPAAFTTPLRSGTRAYVLRRFELEAWFRAQERYAITDLALVPPIVIMAINSPLAKKYSLGAVKWGMCGAAPLDRRPQARMQALISDGAPLTQVWGMTETSCVCLRHPYPNNDTTGSVGRPIANVDTKLVDDEGNDITGHDVRGELCVRGPTIIRGYFENPEANKRDWDKDGFFHTGDIAYVDGKTGLYYIVDRKKELIKVRGFQVAPGEVEGTLLSHPNIVDAAVIGVPDPVREGGELPRAYLVRRAGDNVKLSEQDVHTYIKEKLASYKRLEGGVIFVNEIPKNASGKILKRVLREQAQAESKRSDAKL